MQREAAGALPPYAKFAAHHVPDVITIGCIRNSSGSKQSWSALCVLSAGVCRVPLPLFPCACPVQICDEQASELRRAEEQLAAVQSALAARTSQVSHVHMQGGSRTGQSKRK